MSDDRFPTRLAIRLAVLPIALVIAGIAQASRSGGCSSGSSYDPGPLASHEEVEAARAKVQAMDKARREALAKAKEAIAPRPDLGKCPVRFEPAAANKNTGLVPRETTSGYDVPRWKANRPNDILANIGDELLAIEQIGIAFADEVGDKPGPRVFRFESDARRDSVAKRDMDEAVVPGRSPEDFELVIDHEIEGQAKGESFEGGMLLGRFYVWDHGKAAIVCAATLLATSSDHIRFQTEPGGGGDDKLAPLLRSDLREQALVQAKEHLFVAGPPADELVTDAGAGDAGARDAGARDAGAHRKESH